MFFGSLEPLLLRIIGYFLGSISVLSSFLVIGVALYRGRTLYGWVLHHLMGKSRYDYQNILKKYIERVSAIPGQRLYETVLDFIAEVVDVDGAALLIKGADGRFRVKSLHGVKLAMFIVEQGENFFPFLSKRGHVLTRDMLNGSSVPSRVKNEGLKFFIEFGAQAVLPMYVGTEMYGMITLGERGRGDFDDETIKLMEFLGMQFAALIHNSTLYKVLLKQNKKLQEVKCFRQELLTSFSHQMRTPLNAVIGIAELMAEGGDGPVNDAQINHLSMVRKSGVDLLKAMETLIDLSKLENNQMKLDVKRINISRLIRSVLETVNFNGIKDLTFNSSDVEQFGVYGDETRLTQVFRNLFATIAKNAGTRKIGISAAKKGEMLKVSISNLGKTDPKAVSQLKANTNPLNMDGEYGLDFALSQKIIEMHGGKVWFSNGTSKIVDLNVTLPLRPACASSLYS